VVTTTAEVPWLSFPLFFALTRTSRDLVIAPKHYPNSLKCELYINHAQEDLKISPDGGKCGLPAEFILEFMQDGRTPDRIPLTCPSNGPAQVYSNLYPSLNGSSQPTGLPTFTMTSNSLNMFIDHHSATLYALVFGAELVPILTLARSAGAGTQRREFFLSKVVTDGKRIYDC
jgi:hypothetical protein